MRNAKPCHAVASADNDLARDAPTHGLAVIFEFAHHNSFTTNRHLELSQNRMDDVAICQLGHTVRLQEVVT